MDFASSLHCACKNGNESVVTALLQQGADVHAKDDDGTTALHLASEHGQVECLKILIDNLANVHEESKTGKTALYLASKNGHVICVETLIRKGAMVNHKSKPGWTALHLASQNGHLDCVKLLIDNAANVNQKSDLGWTALHLACQRGRLECMKILLDSGVNVNEESKHGWTALHSASQNSSAECLKILIENEANLDKKSEDGTTALHLASEHGQVECLKILIDNLANVHEESKNCWSALFYACENGHTECVKILIENKANVNHEDKDGWSALFYACQNGHAKCLKILIENGANVNHEDKGGSTALFLACLHGHVECVKILIENGANVNHEDKDGYAALVITSEVGYAECVKILVENKANVNHETKVGQTVLYYACGNGHAECVKILVKNKAHIHHEAKDGSTAMLIACQSGHAECVQILIENGANVNHENKRELSPLCIASVSGHLQIVRCLINNGAIINMSTKLGWHTLLGTVFNNYSEVFLDLWKILPEDFKKGSIMNERISPDLNVCNVNEYENNNKNRFLNIDEPNCSSIERIMMNVLFENDKSCVSQADKKLEETAVETNISHVPEEVFSDNSENQQFNKKTALRNIKDIFIYFIYHYKNDFLPLLKLRMNDAPDAFNNSFQSRNIESFLETPWMRVCLSQISTLKTKKDPHYTERMYPAIKFYTADNEPERKLYDSFMVPGHRVKLEEDCYYRVHAYCILEWEIELLTKHHSELVFESGKLFRCELWDIGKLDLCQALMQKEDILYRDYSENSTMFSTSTSENVANNFNAGSRRKLTACFIEFQVVKIDQNLAQEFNNVMGHEICTTFNCVDISKFSVFASEKEVLTVNSTPKKIVSLISKGGPAIQQKAVIILVNARIISGCIKAESKEKIVFDSICNLAVLEHLALQDPATYLLQAKDLRRNIENFFHRVQNILMKFPDDQRLDNKELTCTQVWRKMRLFDYIVKKLDTFSLPLLEKIQTNLPILFENFENSFAENWSPLVYKLLKNLEEFCLNQNSDFLKENLINFYKSICIASNIGISIEPNLDVETMLNGIKSCFLICGQIKENEPLVNHLIRFEFSDRLLNLTEEQKNSIMQNFAELLPKKRAERFIDPTKCYGEPEEYINLFYRNAYETNKQMLEPLLRSNIGDEFYEKHSSAILIIFEQFVIKLKEWEPSLFYMRSSHTSRRENILAIPGQMKNVCCLFNGFLRESAKEDINQEITKIAAYFPPEPNISKFWMDPVLVLSNKEYSALQIFLNIDIQETLESLVIGLFACGWFNVDSEDEWGEYEFIRLQS